VYIFRTILRYARMRSNACAENTKNEGLCWLLSASSGDQAVNAQQYERADNCKDQMRDIEYVVVRASVCPEKSAPDEAADDRTCDSEKNRDDVAARVSSRHDRFGNRARNETEDNPYDDVNHVFLFLCESAFLFRARWL